MKKRFKSRNKHKFLKTRVFIFLFLIYVFFSILYKILFVIYKKDMDDELLLKKVIEYSELNTYDKRIIDISPEKILKYTLDIDLIKNDDRAIKLVNKELDKYNVYIYNTHESEEYSMSNEDVYNIKPTIKTADYILQEYLNDVNINSRVENKRVSLYLKNNGWRYNRSYDVSRLFLEELNFDDIDIAVDIHRDSSDKFSTTCVYDGIQYAKVLFIVGGENKNYLENQKLSNQLNNNIESIVPGISRGVIVKKGEGVNGVYNQDISNKIILIEVGGQYNTIDEVNNTMKVVSKAIFKYLEMIK